MSNAAIFSMFHKTGLQVNFQINGDDPQAYIKRVGDAISGALASDWSVSEPEKALSGSRTYEINGWVFGRSAKQSVPVVWLYSPVSPMHKVAHVYSEKIMSLPIGFNPADTSIKPYPGGMAPKRKDAETDGYFNKCKPFTVLVEDTGEDFEGHDVYRFVKVLSAESSEDILKNQPEPAHVQAPSIQQPPPEIDDCAPEEKNPFTDPLVGATSPFIRLENKIKLLFKADTDAAAKWMITRFTSRVTPDNVRFSITGLSGEECEAIWSALNDKPDNFKATFAKYVTEQGQASGK